MGFFGVLLLVVPDDTTAALVAGRGDADELESKNMLHELTPGEMVRTRDFWMLWWCYFLVMQAVSYASAYIKVFGQNQVPGMTDHKLAVMAGVAAIGNGVGRALWG